MLENCNMTAGTPANRRHIGDLIDRLHYNAEFRRAKLVDYPSDTRNADAATISESIASELESGRFSEELAWEHATFWEDERTAPLVGEAERDLVNGLGFHTFASDADGLLSEVNSATRNAMPFGDDVDFIDESEEGEAA